MIQGLKNSTWSIRRPIHPVRRAGDVPGLQPPFSSSPKNQEELEKLEKILTGMEGKN